MIKQMLNILADMTESSERVNPNILMLKFTVVNAFIIENRKAKCWVLVDTGLESSAPYIINKAREHFGDKRPEYILLTHGHFDHVGSVKKLADRWGAPVYAHKREIPYITGQKSYPKAEPKADEGLVAKMSAYFPNEPINLGEKVKPLPDDGTVPGMQDWEWLETPGHTKGHISLFRQKDGILIAGDAFTGTKQESLLSVTTQKEKIKGPPAYFTEDWKSAEESVVRLQKLKPKIALFSHGKPLKDEALTKHLNLLAEEFEGIAVPNYKR